MAASMTIVDLVREQAPAGSVIRLNYVELDAEGWHVEASVRIPPTADHANHLTVGPLIDDPAQ